MYSKTNALSYMTAGALPKGFEKGQKTTQTKKGGADKTGLAIVIGMIAIGVIVAGLGATGVIPIFDGMMPEQTTSAPVMQEKPSTSSYTMQSSVATGSYAPSIGDFYGYLEFHISHGDVKSMIGDDRTDTLVISIYTYDDGELVVDLDPQFIGSFADGTYFVIVDNEEFNDYEQAGTELYIPFELGTEKIEIVGSYILS